MAQEQESLGDAWCEKCMEVVEIADIFDDTIQEYQGQRGVHVTQLYCGHSIAVPDGTFYPFP